MKAKLLLILLAVAIATGSMTACKKKSAAAPATGKESTAVDTTMKKGREAVPMDSTKR